MDRSRFAGRCDRAAHGPALGYTKGCARVPGGSPRWRQHGQSTDFDVCNGGGPSAARLRGSDAAWAAVLPPPEATDFSAETFKCLSDVFGEMTDVRFAKGQRSAMACDADDGALSLFFLPAAAQSS